MAYIIGIDLGTTNCTLAYVSKEGTKIEQFKINQALELRRQGAISILPSFIYFPLDEELKALKAEVNYSVGHFAKQRGAELPGRCIASAKSWLCHDGIDRRKALLPVHADDDGIKLSPVDACKALLEHLKEAWNAAMPAASFKEQTVLITVPASFDPSARQLVLEAAEKADYPEILLMEEPQAAFYAWLDQHQENWREQLDVGDKVLVVDIGGGTTDFSLISVEDLEGGLHLERLAVGSHLLLGGDNMDLALAYMAKARFEEKGSELDDWQFAQLIPECRRAKEVFLSEEPPEKLSLAIQGRGSSLIGNSLSIELKRKEVLNALVDGFFPLINPEERSNVEKRLGIQEIGLPYAQDPRITGQLAKFLSMTGDSESTSMADFIQPTTVLFNGGVMKAHAFRQRIEEVLNKWAKKTGKKKVKILEDVDLDHAVSRGAVYYGLARQGKAIRIKGGTNRSYFIGIEGATPAVPGLSAPLQALCVVPFGMEEGTSGVLQGQQFSLMLGKQATFRFFSRSTPKLSTGAQAELGSMVKKWQMELTELHPIETVLDKAGEEATSVRVTLESKVTELGVLELWCVAENGRRWKLEFDLRHSQ